MHTMVRLWQRRSGVVLACSLQVRERHEIIVGATTCLGRRVRSAFTSSSVKSCQLQANETITSGAHVLFSC